MVIIEEGLHYELTTGYPQPIYSLTTAYLQPHPRPLSEWNNPT
ncbi:hypothetical protein [Prevotella sp.]